MTRQIFQLDFEAVATVFGDFCGVKKEFRGFCLLEFLLFLVGTEVNFSLKLFNGRL